jgi:DNA-binding CsgD family transcriptional regulator
VVHPDGTVEPLTPAGARWLELLLVPKGDGPRSRTAILTMAQLVGSAMPGGGHRPDTRLRLRAANGRWVTLYAEPTLVGDGVAVIIEPGRSQDVAMVLARAHGLSVREQEVVLAIARGDSTAEIEAEMFVSTHTVRDHVKSALAKVGVGSRSELVATLFERHYATDFFQRMTAG